MSRALLAASALVALAVSGCMGGTVGPFGGGMHGAGGGNDAQGPSAVPDARELVVVATDFRFEPTDIRIAVGETVNLVLDNRGRVYHDLTIADLEFTIVAETGARGSGALVASQPGSYALECSVPGHAEAGMTGTLLVE
ncbi:MAG: cupredoxin domain-containing protein [Candidatus Limnocylindria bacterium]